VSQNKNVNVSLAKFQSWSEGFNIVRVIMFGIQDLDDFHCNKYNACHRDKKNK
jgi:hypothetical protein